MEKTILDYLVLIRKRLWLIAAFVLISCITTFYVSENFVKPVYSASSQLLINNITGAEGSNELNQVSTSLNLVESYRQILTSPAIMGKVVAEHPEFGVNPSELSEKLKIQSSDKSQVIGLTIEGEDYQTAAAMVNSITQTFTRSVPELMNMNNVKILNLADIVNQPEPINGSPVMNIAISFLVSLMIALGTIVFLESINATLRNEKEAEADLGLPVIGSIPLMRKKDLSGTVGNSKERVGERTYAAIE
ncbi:Wzz/FepE/Etk N-terminal domain-containing protein [Paenibacillus sp. P96]|uniref:Wzz/FepE/Etk N-terminal domain-containing protein n=1 Tax=Paenibacillus zeirhizosphaerae TaxID=2987519 RepID=A0ABT9FW57_9BACL|nr:Wzz/FepE/Etk N-terminal domain-containing protein [Paenibacillus sp. P96]MDP4098961.1 Wzz/FepE/Etk N-terminal domain-containing protein [Paenibacillus sp. P96]